MIGVMTRSMEDLDLELDLEVAESPGRGVVGKTGRVITAPFRFVGGLVMLVAKLVGAVVGIVMLPFVLVGALLRKIIGLIADIVYGIWRLVTWVIALVAGALLLVLKLLDATVGNLVRLVFKVVFGTLKFVLKVITFGKLGKKAIEVASDDD